jgi:hypothetical protein
MDGSDPMNGRAQGIPKAALALYILAAAILVLGAGPLLLYIAFGPEDGNPVGLGILFFASFMFAGPVLLFGIGVHLLSKWRGGKPDWEPPAGWNPARMDARLDAKPGARKTRRSPSADPLADLADKVRRAAGKSSGDTAHRRRDPGSEPTGDSGPNWP